MVEPVSAPPARPFPIELSLLVAVQLPVCVVEPVSMEPLDQRQLGVVPCFARSGLVPIGEWTLMIAGMNFAHLTHHYAERKPSATLRCQ